MRWSHGEVDRTPYVGHLWFFFKVQKDEQSIWMQVDLALRDGYRMIWVQR